MGSTRPATAKGEDLDLTLLGELEASVLELTGALEGKSASPASGQAGDAREDLSAQDERRKDNSLSFVDDLEKELDAELAQLIPSDQLGSLFAEYEHELRQRGAATYGKVFDAAEASDVARPRVAPLAPTKKKGTAGASDESDERLTGSAASSGGLSPPYDLRASPGVTSRGNRSSPAQEGGDGGADRSKSKFGPPRPGLDANADDRTVDGERDTTYILSPGQDDQTSSAANVGFNSRQAGKSSQTQRATTPVSPVLEEGEDHQSLSGEAGDEVHRLIPAPIDTSSYADVTRTYSLKEHRSAPLAKREPVEMPRPPRTASMMTSAGSSDSVAGWAVPIQFEFSPETRGGIALSPPTDSPEESKSAEVGDGSARTEQDDGPKRTCRLYIKDTDQVKTMPFTSNTTVKDILPIIRRVVDEESDDWTVFEVVNWLGVERPLRDQEHLETILAGWSRDSLNASLNARTNAVPATDEEMLMVKKNEHRESLTEQSNSTENYPPLFGWLYLEVKSGKWAKRFVAIKNGTVTAAKDGKGTGETALCSLLAFDVYTTTKPRKRSPSKFCFCLKSQKHPDISESPEAGYAHFLCAEHLDKMRDWVLSLRAARTQVICTEEKRRRVLLAADVKKEERKRREHLDTEIRMKKLPLVPSAASRSAQGQLDVGTSATSQDAESGSAQDWRSAGAVKTSAGPTSASAATTTELRRHKTYDGVRPWPGRIDITGAVTDAGTNADGRIEPSPRVTLPHITPPLAHGGEPAPPTTSTSGPGLKRPKGGGGEGTGAQPLVQLDVRPEQQHTDWLMKQKSKTTPPPPLLRFDGPISSVKR